MSPRSHHVIVVDDNTDLLSMVGGLVKRKGFQVSLLMNGDDLVHQMQQNSTSLVVMDMLLSGSDGREVCRSLRRDPALAAVPIIMMSALPGAKMDCLAAGADGFLSKPFEMSEMYDLIGRLVR